MNKGKINPVPALVSVSPITFFQCITSSAICQLIHFSSRSESQTRKRDKIGAHFLIGNENSEQCAACAEIMSKRRYQQHFQCIVESTWFNGDRNDRTDQQYTEENDLQTGSPTIDDIRIINYTVK